MCALFYSCCGDICLKKKRFRDFYFLLEIKKSTFPQGGDEKNDVMLKIGFGYFLPPEKKPKMCFRFMLQWSRETRM